MTVSRLRHHALRALLLFVSVALLSGWAGRGADAQSEAACPSTGAVLHVSLHPPATATATAFDVGLLGSLQQSSCLAGAGLRSTYGVSTHCTPGTLTGCSLDIPALVPGEWVHRVAVITTGQLQGRRGLLLDASAGSTNLDWPLFRSVFTVNTLADSDTCMGCLRDAITRAEAALKPALIQFTPSLAGSIVLTSGLPPLMTGADTIDGFDLNGMALARTIDVNGLNRAAFAIRSADNAILGLQITNVGGDSDSVVIENVGADNNFLDQLQIVGRSLQTCGTDNDGCLIDNVCHTTKTDPPVGACGDDGIAIRISAGATRPNIVRASDVSGAFDKGIKVSEFAVANIEQSYVHDNRDGGIQATFSGQIVATENLIENNQGTTSANGLAANGPVEGSPTPARITTMGNIIRTNSLRGISVRSLSTVQLVDDFVCGAKAFGLTIFDAANLSAAAVVDGIATVYNAAGGARVQDASRADFGGFVSKGNNAFAFNGPSPDSRQVNLQNGTAFTVSAGNNQWQHCGPAWTCNDAAIQANDVLSDSGAGPITIAPTQPNDRRSPPTIDRVVPTTAKAGDLIRIYGSGFDAIDGTGPGASCTSLADVNSCFPLHGNCVLIGNQPAQVIAVTPGMLAVRAPFTCVSTVPVAVRTRYSRGAGRASFCTTESDVSPASDTRDALPSSSS